MSIQIHVTQEHIQKGESHGAYFCPVALALRDAIGTAVAVSQSEILSVDMEQEVIRKSTTPPDVRNFIQAFDAGEPVQPFTFELELSR